MSTSTPRRWTRRRQVTASDVVVWVLFVGVWAGVVLAACALLILVWPA